MTPWTSVVSYHTDPEACGVARFSAQLAQRLGVPLRRATHPVTWGDHPLLSVKFSEWCPHGGCAVHDQLWHDEPPPGYSHERPGRVWKLYDLGVPALVTPHRLGVAPVFFTFGMAHKIELEKFRYLKQLYPDWELWISTAEHEGAGPSRVSELLALWGPRAYDLGHLTDAALSIIWSRTTAFVAFFQDGLRANNSSVHAALDAGVPVVTNHGPHTPADLVARTHALGDLRRGGVLHRWEHGSPYTWARLLKELECANRTSSSAIA